MNRDQRNQPSVTTRETRVLPQNPMKKFLVLSLTLGCALALTARVTPAQAEDTLPTIPYPALTPRSERADLQVWQTAPAPTPQGTFFNSVAQFFTGFDTNSTTFLTDTVDIWAGADTVNNQNMAASLGIEFLPLHSSSNSFLAALSVESVTRNATVAGTIVSEQAGFGYNFTHFDTRITGYLDGGYRFDTRQGYLAPGIRIKKALTENTYMGVGLELPIYLNHDNGQPSGAPSPTPSVFTGFKF